MGTKMKGLFKGLRYISHIFEEEKEDEMQIGLPTDVRHVAHIGWGGGASSAEPPPSWIKGFECSPETLGFNGDNKEKTDLRSSKPRRDSWEGSRSSRRHRNEADGDSPKKKEGSTRPRHSRLINSKDSSEDSVRSARLSTELSPVRESQNDLPEIPKKARKKKPRDADSRSSRSISKNSEC